MPGGLGGALGGGAGDVSGAGGDLSSLFGGGGFGGDGGFNVGGDTSSLDPFSAAFGGGGVGDLGAIGDPISQMLMGGGSPMNLGGQVSQAGNPVTQGGTYGSTDQDQNNQPSGGGGVGGAQQQVTPALGGASGSWDQITQPAGPQGWGGNQPNWAAPPWPTTPSQQYGTLQDAATQAQAQGLTPQQQGQFANYFSPQNQPTALTPQQQAAQFANYFSPQTSTQVAPNAMSTLPGDTSQAQGPQPSPDVLSAPSQGPAAAYTQATGPAGTALSAQGPQAAQPAAAAPTDPTEDPDKADPAKAATDPSQPQFPRGGGPLRTGQKITDNSGQTWTNIGNGLLRNDKTGQTTSAFASNEPGAGGGNAGQIGNVLKSVEPQLERAFGMPQGMLARVLPGMLRAMGMPPGLINGIMNAFTGGGGGGRTGIPGEPSGTEAPEGDGEREPSEPGTEAPGGEPPTAGGGADTAFDRPGVSYGSTTAQPTLAAPGVQRSPVTQYAGTTNQQGTVGAPAPSPETTARLAPSGPGTPTAGRPETMTNLPARATSGIPANPTWMQSAGYPSPQNVAPSGMGRAGFDPALRNDRSRSVAQLQQNPQLMDRLRRIAYNEQGSNPRGVQSVIESAFNRASVRGQSMQQVLRWHRLEPGGYYQPGGGLRGNAYMSPRARAAFNQGFANAVAGSNISGYATDNSSAGQTRKDERIGPSGQQNFHPRTYYSGETFFAPGGAEPMWHQRWVRWMGNLGTQVAMQ
jgi:hypothetical protein